MPTEKPNFFICSNCKVPLGECLCGRIRGESPREVIIKNYFPLINLDLKNIWNPFMKNHERIVTSPNPEEFPPGFLKERFENEWGTPPSFNKEEDFSLMEKTNLPELRLPLPREDFPFKLSEPLADLRPCAYQGKPEGNGLFEERTPCTYGFPGDGDKPSMAFDSSEKPTTGPNKSLKLSLLVIDQYQLPARRIRTCLATILPEVAKKCSKFQPKEQE